VKSRIIDVIVLRTPQSDRFRPIQKVFEKDDRFRITLLDSTMANDYLSLNRIGVDFEQNFFNFFEGRNMTPREIACAHTHNLGRQLISNNINGGVILEDDARIIDINEFYKQVEYFLDKFKDSNSILNLTGFRNIKNRNRSDVDLFKLMGYPDLAVAYALTKSAATNLLFSNTPISMVADWPIVKSKYYVPYNPFVQHGDKNTSSVILGDADDYRLGANKLTILSYLLFIKYPKAKKLEVSSYYFKRVFLKRIFWHFDFLLLKFSNIRFLK
jgi:GR25 family glycosyltransferase involved in LPS biosynthesis